MPYLEEVQLLSDVYNMLELMNWHCANQCPIGRQTITEIEINEIFQLTLQVCVMLKNSSFIQEELIDIAYDGVISENEKPRINEILAILDIISNNAAALKLWVQKNIS